MSQQGISGTWVDIIIKHTISFHSGPQCFFFLIIDYAAHCNEYYLLLSPAPDGFPVVGLVNGESQNTVNIIFMLIFDF